MTDGRDERAARRRAEWSAEIVEAGTPKRGLYEALSPAERLAALTRLSRRAWLATGKPEPEPQPRSEWPGEIFELHHA